MFSIVAKWDDDLAPSGVNNKESEDEAKEVVKTLIAKGRTEAFYFEDNSADGQECWRIPKHWRVKSEEKSAALDQDSLDAEILSTNMAELRAERNKRLGASDIRVLPDRWAQMDDDSKTAWTNYRQALRDLPATVDINDWPDITWPTEPS
jgi:hypothetical protein